MSKLQDSLNSIKYDINKPLQKVLLVAVSKTHPESAILAAIDAGQFDFGENYVQELSRKAENLANHPICWHFIGNIQSNKTSQIAKYASWVHTLTKEQHAKRLNDQRPTNLSPLNVLIEVNISEEESKGGLSNYKDINTLATIINSLPNLRLKGLMGMASNTMDEIVIKNQFNLLSSYLEQLNNDGFNLTELSMGMSNDYKLAIECGSTMVRIGSKIFGERSYGN